MRPEPALEAALPVLSQRELARLRQVQARARMQPELALLEEAQPVQ
jgi:hypothetical protein